MTRNVAAAADGSAGIARNIANVADAAQRSSAGMTEAEHAAAELARMSAELQAVVSRFRY